MTKKVIIIDDSVTSLNLLKSKFASVGWEVYGSSSAKEGYDMVFDIAPDLIITDAIMPFVGGFQFVKMMRENEKTSPIPIIVYSVLPENNAKFYIKKDCIEYFISKNENTDELIKLAEKLVREHPVDENQKFEILKMKFSAPPLKQEIKIPDKLEEDSRLNRNELEEKFKEKYNFNFSDEKIFSDFFSILYSALEYELCVVFPHQAFETKKTAFFDIRDILLSPIFQKKLIDKYRANDEVLYKKYAPNLKMITNEDEFSSKLEFNFEYKDKPLADIVIYSKEKSKWNDENNIEVIKKVVYDFFRAYYINKINSVPKKDHFGERYFSDKFNILNPQEPAAKDKNIFIGIINISNYTDIVAYLQKEDSDVLNSKVSETIIKYLGDNEQVIKDDEDEYSIIIQVKDYKNAINRFNFIINSLENIKYDNVALEVQIGAADCEIKGSYNVFEARKNAYKALEKTTPTEKAIIYDATE